MEMKAIDKEKQKSKLKKKWEDFWLKVSDNVMIFLIVFGILLLCAIITVAITYPLISLLCKK